mmetsp:Transcript_30628/g.70118  ORF Transcript_30628/g.70118 Transcript_30628/m.70118 type:complete len:103 (-) Transcript_30628:478-786(-)
MFAWPPFWIYINILRWAAGAVIPTESRIFFTENRAFSSPTPSSVKKQGGGGIQRLFLLSIRRHRLKSRGLVLLVLEKEQRILCNTSSRCFRRTTPSSSSTDA